MITKTSGSTTHPEAVTEGGSSASSVLALRWVFPAPGSSAGRTSALLDRTTIGRETGCTVVLPGQDVSRRHAEIRRAGPLPVLRDLESRNGSWVNGARMRVDEEIPLGPNDVVRIGEWVGIVVEVPRGEAARAAELVEIDRGWFGGPSLLRAIDPARRAAPSDLPVIVEGETGTGKEGLARAVHAWSRRAGPFLAVNCAAIQPAMAEGELFGYRRGAFTGAERAHEGFFRAARGGTLFLDEIVELPPPVQAKLLRALEQREVQPLGEARPLPTDVRVICATQEPLAKAVTERRFRHDLLARLDGVTVTLPPLRERRDDVAPLFVRLLQDAPAARAPALDPKLVEALLLYDWPLNVRELALLARRMRVMHAGEPLLKRSMLPDRMAGVVAAGALAADRPERMPDGDAAFDQLVLALRNARGNVSRAAASLGISRARAYRLLDARPAFDVRALRDEDLR